MQYLTEKISELLSSGEPKQELRWGIIGCGRISHDFAQAMRKCQNPNRVVAVAASSMDKALDFRKDLGLEAIAYGSYEELLADPQIDVVYIGVLNNTHSKWTLAALEAGKHVLCEKPMAGTVHEIKAMAEKAREKNKFLMEAFWSRFFPVYGELKKLIDSEKLGKPKIVHASFCRAPLADNRKRPDLAECPLNDIGSYCVQFAMFCFGGERPSRVHIEGFKNETGDVDMGGNITLEFPSGGKAYLIYTCVSHNTNGAFVSFDNGVAQIPEFFYCPTRLITIEGKPMPDSNPKIEQFPLNDDAKYNFSNASGLRYEADHVYECVMKEKTESDVMPLEDSIKVAEVVDELRMQLGVEFPHDYMRIDI